MGCAGNRIDFDIAVLVMLMDNNLYIGFNTRPQDLTLIIRGAALVGNKATGFGFHVWAINANEYNKGWRPETGSCYEETTARYGKIE